MLIASRTCFDSMGVLSTYILAKKRSIRIHEPIFKKKKDTHLGPVSLNIHPRCRYFLRTRLHSCQVQRS